MLTDREKLDIIVLIIINDKEGITEQHILKEIDMEKLRKLALLLIGGLRIWKKRCEDWEKGILKRKDK